MERYTKYHNGIAVIKDKALHKEAMAELAKYEDTGITPEEIMDGKMLTGWIPVEERLPKPHTDVLVAVMDVGEEASIFIDCLTDNNGTLTWDTFNGALQRVPAWMPLPESYKI